MYLFVNLYWQPMDVDAEGGLFKYEFGTMTYNIQQYIDKGLSHTTTIPIILFYFMQQGQKYTHYRTTLKLIRHIRAVLNAVTSKCYWNAGSIVTCKIILLGKCT